MPPVIAVQPHMPGMAMIEPIRLELQCPGLDMGAREGVPRCGKSPRVLAVAAQEVPPVPLVHITSEGCRHMPGGWVLGNASHRCSYYYSQLIGELKHKAHPGTRFAPGA